MEEQRGFVGSLVDLSFSAFVTTRLVPILYIIAVVLAGIIAVVVLLSGFMRGIVTGLISLIIAPLAFLLYVILARIWLELVIVLFRVAENTGELVAMARREIGGPA